MDGEAPDHDGPVDAHLERCAGCRQWLQVAEEVTRRVRIAVAPPSVDVVDSVLARTGLPPARTGRRRSLLRTCLAAIGLVQLALTLAPLVTYPHELHVVHEVGAWDLAFGIALVTAAWSPRRAGGLVPLVAVLFALLVTLTALDVFAGRATVADEGSHLIVGVSLLLLWLLDRSIIGANDPLTGLRVSAPEKSGGSGSVFGRGDSGRKTLADPRRITGAA
jgi:predicted anti-sigma-YlaC factor YlaD